MNLYSLGLMIFYITRTGNFKISDVLKGNFYHPVKKHFWMEKSELNIYTYTYTQDCMCPYFL